MEPEDPSQPAAPPEAPDQEKMEQVKHHRVCQLCLLSKMLIVDRTQIRQRRLAKLGGSGAASPAASSRTAASQSSSALDLSQTSPGTVDKPGAASPSATPKASEGSQSNPFSQLGLRAENQDPSKTAPSSNGAADTRKRRAAEIDTPPMPILSTRKPQAKEESIEDFSERTLSHIFRISVNPDKLEDVHGHRLLFLPGVSAELQETGAPLQLSAEVLDVAIQEAATAWPREKPLLGYLLPCWKRVMRVTKTLRDKSPEKDAVLKEAKRLCMSHCIFALTIPDLFG
jgi:ubiquitin conjugation factor E4 B